MQRRQIPPKPDPDQATDTADPVAKLLQGMVGRPQPKPPAKVQRKQAPPSKQGPSDQNKMPC